MKHRRASFRSFSRRRALSLALVAGLLSAEAPEVRAQRMFHNSTAGPGEIGGVDVAYSPRGDRYLCAWAEPSGVHAVFLDGTGGRLAAAFVLDAEVSRAVIRVAWVAASSSFLVCWQQVGGGKPLLGAWVHAITGDVSPVDAIHASADEWDVAGNLNPDKDRAVLVWIDPRTGYLFAGEVVHGASGEPMRADDRQINLSASRPAISNTGGTPSRYLVTWLTYGRHLIAQTLDNDLETGDHVGIAGDVLGQDNDGDGLHWVIAATVFPFGGPGRTVCYRVRYDVHDERIVVDGDPIDADPDVDRTQLVTDIDFVGESALLSYLRVRGSMHEARVASLDPMTCQTCRRTRVEPASPDERVLRTATTFQGFLSPPDSRSLSVFARESGGVLQLWASGHVESDGSSDPLGGRCGPLGGNLFAPCMVAGRYGNRVQLRAAQPLTGAILVLSSRERWQPFGSCTLVPDLALGHVIPTRTDALGDASAVLFGTPVPSVRGVEFIAQWVVESGVHGTMMSDARSVTIE